MVPELRCPPWPPAPLSVQPPSLPACPSLQGQPLRIEGDGKQSRDFIHVSDIARALVLGFQSGAHGTTINAGTGRDYSVNYLAGLVSSERQQAPARSFDLRRTLADTCRAKNLLHFEAKVDFTAAMTAEVC